MSNVPNTTTFNFQDVCNAIYGYHSPGMNLSQAFVDATGTFDPSYSGAKNNLLNFRNYSPNVIVLTPHYISVATATSKLDWDLIIDNGTSFNYTVTVRIKNVTKGSAWFTIVSSTVYAGTTANAFSGLTTNMSVTNAVGDTIAIELDLNNAGTWSGTVYWDATATLNYDYTI